MPEKGVVVLDKPSGPTSHEVAAWVRDILGVEKAAHTGTLDPRVTGCLPVLFGPAARVSGLFAETPKEYVFVLELHGEPSRSLADVFEEFEGTIYQRPPVQGSARRELREREIEVLELLEQCDTDTNRYLGRIECGAGTYIRKLCHDIGLAVGVGGHMAELRRTKSGGFVVEDACYLQDLADAAAVTDEDPERLNALVTPLVDVLEGHEHLGLPRVEAAPNTVESVGNGAPLYAPGVLRVDEDCAENERCVVVADEDAVAVGTFHGEEAEPVVAPETVFV